MHLFEHGAPPWNDARRTAIAEVMTRSPHTIGGGETLARAYEVMREHHLRHLPVVADGKLVGVLSERDLDVIEAARGGDRLIDSVAAAMASDVLAVAPGDRVADVVRTMGERHHRCAVVVDVRRVIGIFTATDALAMLARAIS